DVGREGLARAVAAGLEARTLHPVLDEPGADGIGALLRQADVARGAAAVVGVALDLDERQLRIAQEDVDDLVEQGVARGEDVRAVRPKAHLPANRDATALNAGE